MERSRDNRRSGGETITEGREGRRERGGVI